MTSHPQAESTAAIARDDEAGANIQPLTMGGALFRDHEEERSHIPTGGKSPVNYIENDADDEFAPEASGPVRVEQMVRGGPVKLAGRIGATQGKVTFISKQGDIDLTESQPVYSQQEEGYLVTTLHLAYSNRFEIATRARTARRRELEVLAPFLADELLSELQILREDVSSVSTASVSGTKPDPGPRNPQGSCGEECWLRTDVPESEPIVGGSYRIPISADPFFRYSAIVPGQTRILCLQPGSADHPVTINIIPMNSNDVGPYAALSYTWGSPTQSKRIIVINKKLHTVSENLYNALLYLRLSDRPRWLWVDAICINQEDMAEKSFQIPMMTSIYRNAQKVVIWLGEHKDNSALAIAGMKLLDREETRKKIMEPAHDEECLRQLNKLYEALLAIYQRPFFGRAWIRQEIAVAKRVEVQCGQDTVSWLGLKRTARRLHSLRNIIKSESAIDPLDFKSDDLGNLKFLSRGWRYGQSALGFMAEAQSVYYYHGGGLLELLMISRHFEATDPRDKVYSVLGLGREPLQAQNASLEPVRPLAAKDSSGLYAALYHHMVRCFTYMRDKVHSTLGLTSEPVSEDTAALTEILAPPPKFIVDYSQSVSQVYQHVAKYFINRDRNLDILCILSTHRGPESSDLPSWTPDWRVTTSHIGLTECWDYIGMKHSSANSALAELQDQDGAGRLIVRAYLVEQIKILLEVTGDVCNTINMAMFGPDETAKHEAETEPFNSGKHVRRFCKTQSRLQFLVPAGAEEGDVIVLLYGSRLPFVIRPLVWDSYLTVEDVTFCKPGAEFELIGPCFHPILMNGHAFMRFQKNYSLPEKIFLI
ncbi:hypothetical protein EPUS_03261 [Endocarpon pusillum Z07020]|uniref:Heterokaryon incompatibility domain-containing protein n=1 Tax=Endocarpon pusillum (strain Z07020 / HMAS-L-300199) TaxID=1263415 RepID=U1GBF1_ENDPU|nr:uncharacterized protein EPUS_03261 [Endocarpon pusillum Z07020]ERF74877.1 hypothetical protein EPUS_03261 [Endocarpon pusillum Z07020]